MPDVPVPHFPKTAVFIAKDDILQGNSDLLKVTLPHPKTGEEALFFLNRKTDVLYEVVIFKESYRSWFIDSSVQQDGTLHFMTAVNSIFIILQYLIKEAAKRYVQLDDILISSSFPDLRYLNPQHIPDLHQVTTEKDIGDTVVYKYDEPKTLAWLETKIDGLVKVLKSRNVSVGRGSNSVNFIQRTSSVTDDDYVRFAHGILSEYLPSEVSENLRIKLGFSVTEENKAPDEPPAKKLKTGPLCDPLEDYSSEVKEKKKEKVTKMTMGQKKLQAADKSRMKDLSNFFSLKRKT